MQLINEEATGDDGGAGARLRRLALQIIGVQLLGYAGAQVTGIHNAAIATTLLDLIDELRPTFRDYVAWLGAWQDNLRLSNGHIAGVTEGQLLSGSIRNGGCPHTC